VTLRAIWATPSAAFEIGDYVKAISSTRSGGIAVPKVGLFDPVGLATVAPTWLVVAADFPAIA
jgi:hypothetical protein